MKYIVYLLFLFILIACQKYEPQLYFDNIDLEQKINVSALLTDDSIAVFLNPSAKKIFTLAGAEPELKLPVFDTSAVVGLLDENQQITTLISKYKRMWWFDTVYIDQLYYGKQMQPIEGFTYRIDVNHPTFGQMSASSRCPILPGISVDSVFENRTIRFYYDNSYFDSTLYVKIYKMSLIDLDKEINNYQIEYSRNGSMFYNYCIVHPAYLNAELLNHYDYRLYAYFFKDDVSDSDTILFEWVVLPSDELSVELRINSDSYHEYLMSVYRYNKSKTSPFSKPVYLYSNFSHGLGFFGIQKHLNFKFNSQL